MKTMLSETAAAKVQNILVEQLGVECHQVTPEAAIEADLGADSLDKVEIGMSVEETFNVTIPDEAMEGILTVGDLCDALADLLERSGQTP